MGDPGLDRLLAAVPRVVFASRLAGDVMVADAVAAFKPEAALEVPAKLELAALPVAVGGAASKAEQCEAAAAATVRGWLIALARSTPDLRAALVARGLEDLERAAACAADDQAFAAALSALEATLRELTAGLTGVRP
jgi:hypothetical protein